MAGEQGIDLPYEPIVDVAPTSRHVSKNLQKILKLAEEGGNHACTGYYPRQNRQKSC